MKHLIKKMYFVLVLTILAGCGRVVDWGMYTFEQSADLQDISLDARRYVRSITVYDQFATAGIFDALWLSDDARTGYVDLFVRRRGKSDDFRNTFLRRQIEENRHFFNFYVLSPFDVPLAEPSSLWQLFLNIDGVLYSPIEFKVTEMEPEYRSIFGKKYTRFKEAYLIKFEAKDSDDNPIIKPDTKKICLHFRSNDKEAILSWELDKEGHLIVEPETKYGAPLYKKNSASCVK